LRPSRHLSWFNSYITEAGQTDPNGSAGNQGKFPSWPLYALLSSFIIAAAMLIPWIQDTRNMLSSLNLGKTIPVGNADAGSYFNTQVLEAVDYGMSNVHPWFANQSIADAAGWTNTFFQETNVQFAATLPNKPHMYIAETGWPTVCHSSNWPRSRAVPCLVRIRRHSTTTRTMARRPPPSLTCRYARSNYQLSGQYSVAL